MPLGNFKMHTHMSGSLTVFVKSFLFLSCFSKRKYTDAFFTKRPLILLLSSYVTSDTPLNFQGPQFPPLTVFFFDSIVTWHWLSNEIYKVPEDTYLFQRAMASSILNPPSVMPTEGFSMSS